jgi:hypothetical protein
LIEGFPRSANTYVREALKLANPSKQFASHLHGLGAVKLATKAAVPAVLLIRKPADSIASLIVRENLPSKAAVRWYIQYHSGAIRLLDAGIIVVPFEVATGAMSRVVGAVNESFGLGLLAPAGSDESLIRERVRHSEAADAGYVSEFRVALPSERRKDALLSARRELQAIPDDMQRAQNLYERIVGSRQCISPA